MALPPKNFTCSGGVQVVDDTTLEISLASTARAIVDAMPAVAVAISANTTLTKATHQGKLLVCTAQVTLTIDGSTDFDANGMCWILALCGSGEKITISGSGATIHTADGKASFVDRYGLGQILAESAADTYVVTCEQNFAAVLGALSDVTITSATNGDVLVYNSGSGDWENLDKATAGILPDVQRVNDNATAVDQSIVVLYGGSGKTLTMPAVSANSIITVKNASGNSWTIGRTGSDVFPASATSETLTDGKSVTYHYDGSATWGRIGALS